MAWLAISGLEINRKNDLWAQKSTNMKRESYLELDKNQLDLCEYYLNSTICAM